MTFGGCRELASGLRMPAFILLDGEEDGAIIVDDGFLRLFMMGGPVRFLSVIIELTATFGHSATCLRCRSHVDAAISFFFSAESLMRHPVQGLLK